MRVPGCSGVVNCVSLSRPRLSPFAPEPITPALRRVADRRWAGDRQRLPAADRGGTAPSGLRAPVRQRRPPTLAPPGSCMPPHSSSQGTPIFFTIDDDIDRDTWNTVALRWLRVINSALGVQRTTCSEEIDVVQSARPPMALSRNSRTPGHRWTWQTRSWSRGQIDPITVLCPGAW